jgi:DNA-binding CsgD family transcriptional regulator
MQHDLMPEVFSEKSYQPAKFTARHALICDLHLIGKTNAEIADQLEYDEARISVLLGTPQAHLYIQQRRDAIANSMPDIYATMECYALEAVSELVREMREGTPKDAVKQRASFGILDRLGYSPIQKHMKPNQGVPLSEEHVSRMERVLDEAQESKRKFVFSGELESGEDGKAA